MMSALAERLRSTLDVAADRVQLDGYRLEISVGWALYPGDAESPEDLVIRADRALREQKSSHGITNRRTRMLGFGETVQA